VRAVDLLVPGLIRVAPPWTTLDATVAGLVDALVAAGRLPAERRADAVRAVLQREAEASTAMLEIGVGVPHARLPGLDGSAVALALSAGGLYEPVPTVPIGIVALVLSPPSAIDDHLRLLAGLGTLLRSASLRAALLEAPDGTAALALLRDHDRAA